MPRRVDGKGVIVTGGTSGIGRAGALAFAREGARLIISGRDPEKGSQTVDLIRRESAGATVEYVAADVTDPDQVNALFDCARDRLGQVDVVWSNAGRNEPLSILEIDLESWHRVIDLNLNGHFYVARAAIPLLRESRGSLLFTGSDFGVVGARGSVAYCAAKGAVTNMTRAIAADCGPLGIRVNCLAAGPVRTEALARRIANSADPQGWEAAQTESVMLGRFADPGEIANLAIFLASDEASFITGGVHLADGGATAWYGV